MALVALALSIRDYVLDLDDPRAPTVAQWEAMTEAERQRVVDMLPRRCRTRSSRPRGTRTAG